MIDVRSGKMPTTSVRRRISLLIGRWGGPRRELWVDQIV
jgi:hypothetical protein